MTEPAVRIRAAFRYVTLGLMEWADPPELTPREYRRLELLPLDARTHADKRRVVHSPRPL